MKLKKIVEHYWSDEHKKSASFRLWDLHSVSLLDCGWEDALRVEPYELPEGNADHGTLGLLRSYIVETGMVNAHFGLTSSDVEDNVRLLALYKACHRIQGSLTAVVDSILKTWNIGGYVPAFTHWQPAGLLEGSQKGMSLSNPLVTLSKVDLKPAAKKLGGPTGDCRELNDLFKMKGDQAVFPYWAFGLNPPVNDAPIQSSDYLEEMCLINWVAAVAAQLHKVCADYRFYASHGFIYEQHQKEYRGSSSIPQKNNPFKLEKVCSILRSLSTIQVEMWEVLAFNGCERTLDSSWQIKNLFRRCTVDLAYAIETFLSVSIIANPVTISGNPSFWTAQSLRDKLTDRVLAGESRITAYESLHSK